jgi:uncharacterized protein YecA (UPF0149 family)
LGVITDSILEYGKPLLEATDGSPEQMQMALNMTQLCWNMALEPEAERGALLDEVLADLDTPEDWKIQVKQMIGPMIERHKQMFPRMHQGRGIQELLDPQVRVIPRAPAARPGKYPGASRNKPCPCGSGLKYKRCCAAG